jgi:hypothetical protein
MNKSTTHFLLALVVVSCATAETRPVAATDAPSKPAAPAPVSPAPQPDAAPQRSEAPARADATPTHGAGDPGPAQITADAGVQLVYTCPMHLEVRQAKPGRCPKCRMPLVLDEPMP